MGLGELFRVVGKRWYVAIPALIVALALPALAYTSIAAKYQSQSTISLLNAQQSAALAPHLGNPFLTFDSSLTPTADFLARRLSSSQSGGDLAARGVTEVVTAKLADNAAGPFIALTVTGTDKAHVFASMQIVDDYAAEQLRVIQTASAPNLQPGALIRSTVIVPPQAPVSQVKSKIEEVAAAGVVGFGMAFLAVFGFENLATRRAARREPSDDETFEPATRDDALDDERLDETPHWPGLEGLDFDDLAVADRETGKS